MPDKRRMDFSQLPRRVLEKNEALFCEGDPGPELYLLMTGELGVFRRGERLATLTQPTAIVGEMSALTGAPRAATVQALRQTTVIVVDEPQKLFTEYPQLGFKLARLLAGRLGGTIERLAALKDRWQSPAGPTPAAPAPAALSADRTGPAPATGVAPAEAPAAPAEFDSDAFSRDALDVLDTIFDDSLGPAS